MSELDALLETMERRDTVLAAEPEIVPTPSASGQGQDIARWAARYGVPATVVTAIWGMESNYGSNFGSFRTVDALATLAYEGRRPAFAQGPGGSNV